MQTRDFQKIDVNRIEIFPPKQIKAGTYTAAIKYRTAANELVDLVIQGPRMDLPFGIKPSDLNPKKVSVDMAFAGVTESVSHHPKTNADGSPSVTVNGDSSYPQIEEKREFNGPEDSATLKFARFLRALDEHIVKKAKENQIAWFKKDVADVGALYKPIVRSSSNPAQYAPTLYQNVSILEGGEFGTEFYDSRDTTKQMTPQEVLTIGRGSKIIPLITFNSLWYSPIGFGVTRFLEQALVFLKHSTKGGFNIDTGLYAVVDDDDNVSTGESEQQTGVSDDYVHHDVVADNNKRARTEV